MGGKPLGSATVELRRSRTLTINPSIALVTPSEKRSFAYKLSDPSVSRSPPVPATAATAAATDACDASTGVGWNSEPVWSVSPSVGMVNNKGTYEAPSTIDRPQRVLVAVTKQCDSAAASVYLSNDPSGADFGDAIGLLIIFVMIMGTLGSYVCTLSSFVASAENRQFVTSRTWWYIMRPLIGGALAVIGYFLFAGGYITGAGTDTGNLIKIGVVSALIGLFEEQALLKLGEIFDVVIKPPEKGAAQLDTSKPGAQGPATQEEGRTPSRRSARLPQYRPGTQNETANDEPNQDA